MKILTLTTLAAVLVVGACNKTDTADDVALTNGTTAGTTVAPADGVDAAFVVEALQGDNSEVAIGQLALAQGQSQKVKTFGKLLVDDHGSHKQELRSLAEANSLEVTDEPSAEGKANFEKLKALSGADFDKEFKAMMVEDHTKDIAKYEKQAASDHAQTAALAQKTLPILRKHLEDANAL